MKAQIIKNIASDYVREHFSLFALNEDRARQVGVYDPQGRDFSLICGYCNKHLRVFSSYGWLIRIPLRRFSFVCLVKFAGREEVKRTTQMVLIFTKQYTSLNVNFRSIEDKLFSVIPKISGLIYYIYYTIYYLLINI